MSTGDIARVRGTDRESRPTAQPVSGPPHHEAPQVPGSPSGVMASDTSARAWEAALGSNGRSDRQLF
jgi:hypothetical protein